ncbi:MAG TPA: hypothetical protein GX505_02380 [Clostridiales bacterium]|nr:hypothetical protein [Clostridiales bacterium]
MPTAFTQKYSEDSSGGMLRFSFYCDICRKEYVSPLARMPDEQGLFQKWKTQKAYNMAFEEAQREAKEHFSCCPICNRWVCDECFRVLPNMDICKECSEKLGEGEKDYGNL